MSTLAGDVHCPLQVMECSDPDELLVLIGKTFAIHDYRENIRSAILIDFYLGNLLFAKVRACVQHVLASVRECGARARARAYALVAYHTVPGGISVVPPQYACPCPCLPTRPCACARRGGHFVYRRVDTRAIDTPSVMPI